MNRQPTYRFGPFEVHPHARQLRKHGVRLKLYGQSFEILLMLLEQPGDVVTREQMRSRIWPEGTFVDFEHSLNTAIKNLRRALSDSAESPAYIETLPRVGYRFLAQVEKVSPEMVADEARTVPTDATATQDSLLRTAGVRGAEAAQAKRKTRWQVAVAAVLLSAAALGAYLQWVRPHAQSAAQGGRVMLAVLPFENLTGDAAQEYFTDGFSEEMIAQISPLDPEHLEVIARTSTLAYKNAHVPLDQIGRQLGVQYVLEGTVRRDADNVRVSAQLTRVKDQTCLWSHEYNRKLSGSLALQDEVAREVVDEIQLTFGDKRYRAAPRPATHAAPASSEAYDFYLRGRYFWNKRTIEAFNQAADYFQQAISKDPNYARAYAGLADTYALMCSWNMVDKNEFVPKARAAALKALQIDDSLAEAHTSLALVVENYDWDWPTAEREYRRAIQLDPGYATAHQWYAEYLTWQGRFDEASLESERARQLDPLSLIIAVDHGAMLYYSRRYPQSIEQFRGVLAMDPHFPRADFVVYPYVKSGMYPEALSGVEGLRHAFGDMDWVLSVRAYAEASAGHSVEARQTLAELQEVVRREHSDPQLLVLPYIGLGDKQQALDSLQQAYAAHSNLITSLKVDPAFDPLRNEPQFQDLLRRVGLAR